MTDCFAWSGVTGENGVQVFKDAAAACPKCNTPVVPGAKFCGNCGQGLG